MNYTSVFECEYIHVSLFENHMFLLIVIGFQFRHPHYRPLHHFLRLQRGTAAVSSPAKGHGRSASRLQKGHGRSAVACKGARPQCRRPPRGKQPQKWGVLRPGGRLLLSGVARSSDSLINRGGTCGPYSGRRRVQSLATSSGLTVGGGLVRGGLVFPSLGNRSCPFDK